MYESLDSLGLKFDLKKQKAFDKYQELFLSFNEKINLISKNDSRVLFEKHIFDSLALNLFLKKYGIQNAKMLDIGTGGGFPSLPAAICFNDLEITAVDSISKKINAIGQISRQLGLKNYCAVCKRAEDLPINYKNSFDIVTSRAVAELRIILEYAMPFAKPGGYFIAFKSIKADEEIIAAQNALNLLNTKIVDKTEYNLPLKDCPKRVLLIFQKIKRTDDKYPRKNGLVRKIPL